MLGDMLRDRGFVSAKAIGLAVICDRIEILACEDVVFRQPGGSLVAGVFRPVEDHWEVGIVGFHAGLLLQQGQAGDAGQVVTVTLDHLLSGLDVGFDAAQIADTHSRVEFAHLGVRGGEVNLLTLDAEVFAVVERRPQGLVPVGHAAALHGMEDLGGMEGEHGRIAEAGRADPVLLHPEGVGRVVDNLQTVLLRDALNGLHITEGPVDVDRHDGGGLGGDQDLELRRV